MKHAWAVRAVLWPVVLICGSFSAAQVTINVPANQPTIQAGIDAAANGDTVLVAPGIYFENINFKGKAITLKSSGGASATTIDGTNKASVVTFNTAETRASVLDGFTITHGYDFFNGGGVSISGASPTVQNNIITGNHSVWGLGVHITGGSPLIKNNNVTGNTVNGGSSGEPGGGIGLLGADNPQIIGNTISNNQMPGGGFGGGIGVNGNAGLIAGNTITSNYVYNSGGGIQVINSTNGTIINNLIANNTDGGAGFGPGADDGVAISVPSGNQGVSFLNNTLVNNALFVQGFDSGTVIQNNLVYITGSQNPLGCGTYPGQVPLIKNNDFYSTNGTPNSGLCSTGVIGTNGNVSVDPLFGNPANDFQLMPTSPVIDAGLNMGVSATTDLG